MSDSTLNSEAPQRLPLGRLPVVDPAPDLWQRIAVAQQRRVRRAQVRRRFAFAGGASAAVVLLIALGLGLGGEHTAARDAVDWQARAQALELQLRALSASRPAGAAALLVATTQNELVLVDAALQAAYDNGGDRERLNPLWKRRSELLGALLQARSNDVEISRI
jgi:hypothetical protein